MFGWLHPYRFRQKLTIQSAYVDAALTDFPVLIVTDKVQYGNDKKLAVTTADGTTQCYVEVEKSDTRGAILWTKVPSVSDSADTTLYLYYDSAVPDNDSYVGYVNSAVAANVWDSNFVLVDHMQDYGDTSHTVDSTSNNNDGTKVGAANPVEASAKIGNGQNHVLSDRIDFGNIVLGNTVTAEVWLNCGTQTLNEYPYIIGQAKSDVSDINWGFDVRSNSGDIWVRGGGGAWVTLSGWDDSAWHHLAMTYNSTGNLIGYLDSTASSQAAGGNSFASTRNIYSMYNEVRNEYAEGLLDEVRISTTDRSAAWIKASYYSESNTLLDYSNTWEDRTAIIPQKRSPAPTPPASVSSMLRIKEWLMSEVAE